MNIHEYQAKELLAKFGVPVPAGYAAMSVEEAVAAARKLPGPSVGGQGADPRRRPRQGQVQGTRRPTPRAASASPTRSTKSATMRPRCSARRWSRSRPARRASRSSGSTSPTASTSRKEFYLALLVDRDSGRIAIVVSTEGGMDIEAVAHDTPEKIETLHHRPGDRADAAPRPRRRRRARPDGDLAKQAGNVLAKLYDAFLGTDARQIEINPLAVTDDGKLLVLDAKVGVRQQCRVPPPRPRAAARPHRGRPDGDRGVEIRPRLHQAGRRHRLHGQRRRPRHGDDGHHQARTAARPPTSSTSAAAPTRKRSPRRSRSSSPIRR